MRQIIHFIDDFLNSITMYRLILYGLIILVIQSFLLSFVGTLSFTLSQLAVSLGLLLTVCLMTNFIFAWLYKVPANVESVYITALILFLIFSPFIFVADIPILIAAGVMSMASKYLLALHRKHFFNPAAITAVILGFFANGMIIWWVGSTVMLPVTLAVGLLIVRKIRRFHLLFAFLISALLTLSIYATLSNINVMNFLTQVLTSWPLFFFGTIMLTEPLTTPPTYKLRVIYGAIVGVIFGVQFHIGPIYATPQLALVIGNIFSYLVSAKKKYLLQLIDKKLIAKDIYEFTFRPDQQPKFSAGQYFEWTIPATGADSRGNRRYFTIASAPTETEIRLGVKIPSQSSSFKRTLLQMKKGTNIFAGQLAGDFTLPVNPTQKLVFIAGGIGITPFRSMAQWFIDAKQTRDVTLLYACSSVEEFVYQDVFDRMQKMGWKISYVITKAENAPKKWNGLTGHLTAQMIQQKIPDYAQRIFYLSGPNAMVQAYEEMLGTLHIRKQNIVVDYFPGY